MNPSSEIFIGVLAGLLTSALLVLLNKLTVNVFFPWYREWSYAGLRIDGTWYRIAKAQKTVLEISQSATKLSGRATVIKTLQGDDVKIDDIRMFDVTGWIDNRFVVLQLKQADRAKLGAITYLLGISGDGTELDGAVQWYAPLANAIHHGDVQLFRDEHRASIAIKAAVRNKYEPTPIAARSVKVQQRESNGA